MEGVPVIEPTLAELIERRRLALAEMRANARNLEAFSAAAKREAELAAQIRQLRRGLV